MLATNPLRRPRAAASLSVWLWAALGAACALEPTIADTVDLGDHFESPDLALDEDFFYCIIQPEVLTLHSCAEGLPSEAGSCHIDRSALRLSQVTEPIRCQAGDLVGAPPLDAERNLERVRVSVQVDPDSSPLYRRPIGLDSHPRVIFPPDDPAAEAIRQWILMGAP